MIKIKLSLLFLFWTYFTSAQLKYLVEDFEGFTDGNSDLKANGIFTFGNAKANIDGKLAFGQYYSGERYICLKKDGKQAFGGWGKGLGANIQLDLSTDYLNFYYYQPATNDTNTIRIELLEDDNGNNTHEKEKDDSWAYIQNLKTKGSWELVSIPLKKFRDTNHGGDGIFNINYHEGKLFSLVISFLDSVHLDKKQLWCFDFLCFSKGKLPVGPHLFAPPPASPDDFCNLGAWSAEGNSANFTEIPVSVENIFKSSPDKKLGVVHFFQPFAFDGGTTQNTYPSTERIDKVVEQGYIPMITLENHFVNTKHSLKQPNLYSIIEGHFDSFFIDWAKQIKLVKGTVLLRILHEFNGDWYPWCIIHNDNDPKLLVKAFRRIHTIFKEQKVTNVKFIWCPNSMSVPQEKWNFIMEAYPGDEFVDYLGLDIYNGAGKGLQLWRSFRKEGIENYFILTQQLPDKPLFICETASRERKALEVGTNQNKAGWIRQMSETLNSDMSKVRLLTWFNEKESFKINSSTEAVNAFLRYVWKDDYFKSGINYILPILKATSD